MQLNINFTCFSNYQFFLLRPFQFLACPFPSSVYLYSFLFVPFLGGFADPCGYVFLRWARGMDPSGLMGLEHPISTLTKPRWAIELQSQGKSVIKKFPLICSIIRVLHQIIWFCFRFYRNIVCGGFGFYHMWFSLFKFCFYFYFCP